MSVNGNTSWPGENKKKKKRKSTITFKILLGLVKINKKKITNKQFLKVFILMVGNVMNKKKKLFQVDPLSDFENKLSEVSHQNKLENYGNNGVITFPRPDNTIKPLENIIGNQKTMILDLSDVVGDFEATLKRLSKPKKNQVQRKPQTETFTGSCKFRKKKLNKI